MVNKGSKNRRKRFIKNNQVHREEVENINWLNKHYKILHNFAQVCSKTLNEEILLRKAYEMVSEVMPTEGFYLASYSEGDSFIRILFLVDNGKSYPQTIIELGENYSTKVINSRQIIHVKDGLDPKHSQCRIGSPMDAVSCIYVPIIIDNEVKGVISAQNFNKFAYRKEHEELLQLIGTQVFTSIETARLYEKVHLMSYTDELTELRNYRAFHTDISQLILEKNQKFTLIMLDLDNFKKINDGYGHDIGDLYLKVFGLGIKSICEADTVGYRYAGDEFMIITKRSVESIEDLFEKLKDYYLQNSINVSDDLISVSFSSGVAVYPDHGSSVDLLKKLADNALYIAKSQGKNQVVMAELIN